MAGRYVSNKRALYGFIALAITYLVIPIDVLPFNLLDDVVITPMFILLAVAKGTSPKLPSGAA